MNDKSCFLGLTESILVGKTAIETLGRQLFLPVRVMRVCVPKVIPG